MTEEPKPVSEAGLSKTLRALKKNDFLAYYVPNGDEARDLVMASVTPGISVGIGGSDTVRKIGLVNSLKDKKVQLLDHWEASLGMEEILAIRKAQLHCDLFLSSVNAVTEQGELISQDGIGNRICAMTFGPAKVFLLASVQKIVPDLAAGFRRISEIAAPMRAQSLNLKLPCTKNNECVDCNEPDRICRATLILHKRPSLTDITVILIGESLGY